MSIMYRPLGIISIAVHLFAILALVIGSGDDFNGGGGGGDGDDLEDGASGENLETLLGGDLSKLTPEEVHKYIKFSLENGAFDRSVFKPKLEAYCRAYEAKPSACSINRIEQLRAWIQVSREDKCVHLANYLQVCHTRQLDACFADLNRKIEAAYNQVDQSTRYNFEHLIEFMKPESTKAHHFATLSVFSHRFDEIAEYLDWQRGRKFENKSDFDCKSNRKCPIKIEYMKYVQMCTRIYESLLDPAGMMLYMIQLEPEREHQMTLKQIEWYRKFKVAHDVNWKGQQKYKDFKKFLQNKRLDLNLMDKAKNLFSFAPFNKQFL